MAPSLESWTLTAQLYRVAAPAANRRSIPSTIAKSTPINAPSHPGQAATSRNSSVRGEALVWARGS
jgi:hypothetical protein